MTTSTSLKHIVARKVCLRGILWSQPHMSSATASAASATGGTSSTGTRIGSASRRWLSTEVVTTSTKELEPTTADSLINTKGGESIIPLAYKEVVRHGPGDGIISLSVGGKEFITLRSTIQTNRVLLEHVLKAEANTELTKGGSVFIDRDAIHFGLILPHLRNQADSLNGDGFGRTSNSSSTSTAKAAIKKFWKIQDLTIPIPKDRQKLQDLFLESRYFQVKEIEDALCRYDVYTQAASYLGSGSANPFQALSEGIKNARRALVATGGVGLVVGSQNEDLQSNVQEVFSDFQKFMGDLTFLVTGRRVEDKEEKSSTETTTEPSIS